MELTGDQLHIFKTGRNWRDFRALFPTVEAALDAHAAAALAETGGAEPTHELHWRHIYHDRASTRRQIFALPLILLGHVSAHHTEFHFVTRHAFSPREARRLVFGRAFASLCYHGCFLGAIIAGVVALIASVMLAFPGSGSKEIAVLVLSFAAFIGLFMASRSTRSLGLDPALRPIAKDAFDLVSIRRIRPF
jgi:hypothetical protein